MFMYEQCFIYPKPNFFNFLLVFSHLLLFQTLKNLVSCWLFVILGDDKFQFRSFDNYKQATFCQIKIMSLTHILFISKKLKFTVIGGEAILSAQILIDHLRAFIIQKFFKSRINVLVFKF